MRQIYSWFPKELYAHVSLERQLKALALAKFRVKIKSLAEEARIIRQEERRLCKRKSYAAAIMVHEHRIDVVRYEQRHTLLAYAMFRGMPYERVERHSATPPNLSRITAIYHSLVGEKISVDEVDSWLLHGKVTAS